MTAVGWMVGGLGLFIFGMWLLTENLKTIASRGLRRRVHRWTASPLTALLWGALAGTTTQSLSALTFVVISVLRSRLLTIESALLVVLGGGLGVTMIVVIAAFDIRTPALCILGLAAVVAVMERLSRFRALACALFGGALMIFGLVLLKDGAAPVAEADWFHEIMDGAGGSLVLAFCVAALLTFVAQSAGAVTIFAISLSTAGAVSMDQVLMMIYGSFTGSAVIQYVLSTGLTGRSRQVAMFMVLYNMLICSLGVPWLLIEIHLDLPGLKALVVSTGLEPAQQMSAFYVVLAVFLLPVLLPLCGAAARLLERLWPVSEIDDLSRPAFIHDHASVDAETSLTLAALEQRRVLQLLSGYFEPVRRSRPLDSRVAAVRSVLGEIDAFLLDLQRLHPTQSADRWNTLMTRQQVLSWLDTALADMCGPLTAPGASPTLRQFRDAMCEGVDAVILSLADAIEADDRTSWSIIEEMTDDRIELVRSVRRRYLTKEPPLHEGEAAIVTRVSNAVEGAFFLLSRLSRDFRA